MLKFLVRGVLIIALLLGAVAFWVLYSDDSITATLTAVPSSGVTEDMYMSRPTQGQQLYPLKTTFGLVAHGVVLSEGDSQGGDGVFVKAPTAVLPIGNDDRTFAVLEGSGFHNGTIEVELNGSVSPNVSRLTKMFARGFIGICFRISDDMTNAECIYIRPENGHSTDPVRKNHAVQYISPPDWDFANLREEAPEKYESAAAVEPNKWHRFRLNVIGETAELYIDDANEPVFIVNDLRHGKEQSGKIGLWVGPGTNGFFRNLTITTIE